MTYIKILVVSNLLIMLSLCLLEVYKSIEVINFEREKEAVCLSELIRNGIERIDIHTSGGECYVAPNAYYSYKPNQ